MITFEKVTPLHVALTRKIQNLNEEVFRGCPHISNLLFLKCRFQDISTDFLALMDNGKFRGYVYVINFIKMSFLTFLAVEPKFHGKGYGSKLLTQVKEMQAGRPIILTAFKPIPEESDYVECLRRKAFYEHNGFIPQPDSDVVYCRTCETYLYGTGVDMTDIRDTFSLYDNMCESYYNPREDWALFSKTSIDLMPGKLVATVNNLNTLRALFGRKDKSNNSLEWKYFFRYDWRDQLLEKNGLVGAKDVTGIITVPAMYDNLKFLNHYFQDRKFNPIVAVKNGKEALISTHKLGWQWTDFEYEKILPITKDKKYYQCWKEGKTGLLDRYGEVVIPVEMDEVEKHGPYYKFTKGNKCGVLVSDMLNGMINNHYFGPYTASLPIFDEIVWPSAEEKCLKVKRKSRWGYLTDEGLFTSSRKKCGIGYNLSERHSFGIKLN